MVIHNGQEYVKELMKYVGIVSDELVRYMPIVERSYFNAVHTLKEEGIVKRAKRAKKKQGTAPSQIGYTYGTMEFLEEEGCLWRKIMRRESYSRSALKTIIPARFLIANYTVGNRRLDYHPNYFGKNYYSDITEWLGITIPLAGDPHGLFRNMENDTYMPLQEIRSRMEWGEDNPRWESPLIHTTVNGVLKKWDRLHLVYSVNTPRFSYIFRAEDKARMEIEKYAGPIESAIIIWRDKEIMLEHKNSTKYAELKKLYKEGVIGTDLSLAGLGEADKLRSMETLIKIR